MLEQRYQNLLDQELKESFQKLTSLSKKEERIYHCFAIVREASKRTLNQRPYDVQIKGALTLIRPCVAEMQTGEGKTLTSVLAIALHSIECPQTHVITANDYLARRDAQWMKPLYDFLGLSVTTISKNMSYEDRVEEYKKSVIYGTISCFAFDYIKDNMRSAQAKKMQRGHFHALIDEIDSILIDESQTPLIISQSVPVNTRIYREINSVVKNLSDEHYETDIEHNSVSLTEKGYDFAEKNFKKRSIIKENNDLHDHENSQINWILNKSLAAHKIFFKDHHYIVKNKKVILIDKNTGRMTPERRLSDGLHQALEAKEQVPIRDESITKGMISIRHYLRLYKSISGMTGTAATDSKEFNQIYNLVVVSIPTNKPCKRIDYDDVFFFSGEARDKYAVDQIKEMYHIGRPVLIGTYSIEYSYRLSSLLDKERIPHRVLNAKHHEEESSIIENAGLLKSVTIATNMAGRGTDIKLNGTSTNVDARKKICDLGGLFIMGMTRNESRRIDNQLKGRSGRQGDPGGSVFYVSLEDPIIKKIGLEKLKTLIESTQLKQNQNKKNQYLKYPLITKAIRRVQKKIENVNYDIRKYTLSYDNVFSSQRNAFYEDREHIIQENDITHFILSLIDRMIDLLQENSINPILTRYIQNKTPIFDNITTKTIEKTKKKILNTVDKNLKKIDPMLLKIEMLNIMDYLWVQHINYVYYLRTTTNIRNIGSSNALQNFSIESQKEFCSMMQKIHIYISVLVLTITTKQKESYSRNLEQ